MRPGRLPEAADRFGTPAYVYNADAVRARLGVLRDLFGSRLGISVRRAGDRGSVDIITLASGIEVEGEAWLATYPCSFADAEEASLTGEFHSVISNRSRRFSF